MSPLIRNYYGDAIKGKPVSGTDLMLYYPAGQHLQFLFQKEIRYEPAVSKSIMSQIKAGDLVFEIGSNIGQHSLQIARKILPEGKLICIEPDSDNYTMLRYNIDKNDCNNVTLVKAAISDQAGEMTFYKDTVTGGRMGSLHKEYALKNFRGATENVQTMPLSYLYDQYGIPDFVKVDVEGAEDKVFYRTEDILPATKYMVEARSETISRIFSLFTGKGFKAYWMDRGNQEVRSESELPGFCNLLFKHN